MAAPLGNEFYKLVAQPGKKPFYSSPEDMEDKIIKFILYCAEQQMPLTVSGLVLWLGFVSVTSLTDYAKKNQAFAQTITRARTLVAMQYEMQLFEQNSAGAVFALKNMGWSDRVEQIITTQKQVFKIGGKELEM